jgi:hypothetical protein
MKKPLLPAAVLAALVAFAGPAKAELITYTFEGMTVNRVGGPIPPTLLITGKFTYDTAAPLVGKLGEVNQFSSAGAISATFGTQTFASDPQRPLAVFLLHQPDGSAPDAFAIRGFLPGSNESLVLGLRSTSHSVFPSATVLPTQLDLADFSEHRVGLLVGDLTTRDGTITSLTRVSSNPEPGGLLLFGTGLAGLFAGAWQRRRRSPA